MPELDQTTLLFVVGSITFLMGILMLHYAKNNPSISGPSYWSSGSFCILTGISLLILFQQSEVVIVIASGVTMLGVSYYLTGIRLFNRRKMFFWLIYGFPLAQMIQATLFFFVWPLPYMRIALFSVLIAVLALLVIREFSRPVLKSYRLAYRMGLIVFIALGGISLFRILFTFSYRPQLFFNLGTINSITFFLYCLITILLLFVFVLMITIDLTEKLNEKIASQQKFYSIISHDLVGPVGSISQILSEVNVPGFASVQVQNVLLKELEKLSTLTYQLLQNLLVWSRSQLDGLSPVFAIFDLDKVIRQNIELQQLVSKTKNISIFYAESSGLNCRADERMVDTVIRNLLSNAIKFTHSGGKITVECKTKAAEVQILIRDTGIGMSKAILDKLFVEHEKIIKAGVRGDKGTGLGLMLCKDFIEQNQGSIQVFSKENFGTEVVIFLPSA